MATKLSTFTKFDNALNRMKAEDEAELNNVIHSHITRTGKMVFTQSQLDSLIQKKINSFKNALTNEYIYKYKVDSNTEFSDSVYALNKEEAIKLAIKEVHLHIDFSNSNYLSSKTIVFNDKKLKIKRVKK